MSIKNKQICYKNTTSCINTFTGEGCGGFVFPVNFTGFGGIFFGLQVLWDSQGASTDGQLKQRVCQWVSCHMLQECLNFLDWEVVT